MKLFETNEMPLVGDGAYAILCLLANKILSTEEKNELNEVLYERFIKQGFDEARSEKVARMLSNAVSQEQGF